MRRGATGVGLVLAVAVIFLLRPRPVASLDDKVCDLVTGWADPGKPSGRVVIAGIDEGSVAQFGRWPWPRDLLGELTHRILDMGAATVVLDLVFPEPDRGVPVSNRAGAAGSDVLAGCTRGFANRTNDDVLTCAISGKPVVIGYYFKFENDAARPYRCVLPSLPLVLIGPSEDQERAFWRASGAVCSVPGISQAAAGGGFLNAAPDPDGRLRRIPLLMEHESRQYPSLALATLNLYRGLSSVQLTINGRGAARLRLDNQVAPLEGQSYLRLRFRGAGGTFPHIAAADILANRAPAEKIKNRIVVVGAWAPGVGDAFATAMDPLLPGPEVQATAIDNLLEGDPFSRPAAAGVWEMALALVVGSASAGALARLRPLEGAGITVALGAGTWAGCILLLSTSGVLLSPLPVTAALAVTLPVLTLFNHLAEKKRAERTERQLVSAHERTRQALEESEFRYRRLVENINDAIIMVDLQGRLVFANQRFREWFGLADGGAGEVTLEDYAAPEWRRALREGHERRVRGEESQGRFEYEGVRADGTRMWIEALVTTVEEDGRITGTQAALRDLTERKRIEAQYLQAQKMESVGRLAGGVAHDFNNLLTVINGYSDLLLARVGVESKFRAYVEEVLSAGHRAAELTQQLLTFSRKELTQPEPVDLNLIVAEASKMFGRVVGEDIELISDLAPELGKVTVDRGQMHQLLMNLVVNARDSMPHGGKLVIETREVEAGGNLILQNPELRPGWYVRLGVIDTGTGMGEDVKQHLFEPFFTTKEPGKGTGLGLATVYGIVRRGGGCIQVASEPGQGTAFHIYLPRTAAEASQALPSDAPSAAPGGSETVLLVEDQEAVRKFDRTILESYGYEVLQASNGSDAIALAQEHRNVIHLLLTDVVLPGMNGRALADQLTEMRPAIKVLYTSGYSEEIIAHHGIVDAGKAFLPKPFSPDELAAKVREVLAGGAEPPRTASKANA